MSDKILNYRDNLKRMIFDMQDAPRPDPALQGVQDTFGQIGMAAQRFLENADSKAAKLATEL
jgi:hypothetical protein